MVFKGVILNLCMTLFNLKLNNIHFLHHLHKFLLSFVCKLDNMRKDVVAFLFNVGVAKCKCCRRVNEIHNKKGMTIGCNNGSISPNKFTKFLTKTFMPCFSTNPFWSLLWLSRILVDLIVYIYIFNTHIILWQKFQIYMVCLVFKVYKMHHLRCSHLWYAHEHWLSSPFERS